MQCLFLLPLSLSFLLFGCASILEYNGTYASLETMPNFVVGKTTKTSARKILGEPSIVDGKRDQTWIYFRQKTKKTAFFKPDVISRTVIVLNFRDSGILKSKDSYSLEDSRIIEISSNKVVSGGRKLTMLQQIFGNMGNFSSQNLSQ